MPSGTVAVLGAHATVDNVYIRRTPACGGMPGVLKYFAGPCWILKVPLGHSTVACGPSLPQKRRMFCSKIRLKTEPPKNQPKVSKRSPQGSQNGARNRQNPQKCRPRERSLSRYQKQHPTSEILEPIWEAGTKLKCVSVVKKHTFQGWRQGRQIVTKMSPKRLLLGGTFASRCTKML